MLVLYEMHRLVEIENADLGFLLYSAKDGIIPSIMGPITGRVTPISMYTIYKGDNIVLRATTL